MRMYSFTADISSCVRRLSFATLLAYCACAGAQTPENAPAPQAVELEVFKGPRSKNLTPPPYPIGERIEANEGWVNLNFMVDPAGKPYEITVSDSTGIPAFEKAAIKSAERWTFEPATLNGVPIDSGYTLKVMFRITDPDKGASADFVKLYRRAFRAVEKKDQTAADAAIARMEVTNLYEDALFNIARYSYLLQWGEKVQQIDALERAIAHEGTATYLPKSTFETALLAMLRLKAESKDFAGVLKVWGDLQKMDIDKEKLAPWPPVITDLQKLKTDDRSYVVEGSFGDSTSWNYTLFKKKFRVQVASGRIAEIKLRCEKRYVFFKFDPTLQYAVNDKFGSCAMELIGDPGTKFALMQS